MILGPRSAVHPLRSLTFALTVTVPLSFAFLYFLAVFSYGLAGDLTARHSLYPPRMFTLPVSTRALVGWPMLYGATTMAVFWLAAALVALRPSGANVPLLWPALFAAALVAWLQALTWMPYGLPGLRMIVAVLLLTLIDAVVLTAMELEVRESVMALVMAPQVPLAYLVARYAVARARRGDTPDWRGAFSRLGRVADAVTSRGGRFPSAESAQAWFERRQHGRSLPAWTALLAPFGVLFLYLVRHEPAVLTALALVGMLLTPPFLAAFVAVTVGRSGSNASRSYGLAPFVATRPLSTAALVVAKLRTAAASTLLTWLVALGAVAVGLTLAGAWAVVVEMAVELTVFFGEPRAIVVALVGLLLLVTATWKQLVQGLAIGLTGRERLIKSSVLVRLSSLVLLGLLVHLLNVDRDARTLAWHSVSWILVVPGAFKMGAAAWVATRLARHRIAGARALLAFAAAWVAAVAALDAVIAWVLDSPLIPRSTPLLIAILAVPLARPAAVLLAVASSRHGGTLPAAVAGGRRALGWTGVLLAAPFAVAVALLVSFQVRNRDNGTLVSSGEQRTYRLYVPESYDPGRPTPLVISLHGGGGWGAAQMQMSRWNEVADEQGLIVVYPSGARGPGPRAWRVTAPQAVGTKDVRFIADLIDTLAASYNIDRSRVYADGLSNGGGMAFALSCALPDRIAAVGLVASAQFLSWSACRDVDLPVPMVAFHGTDDRFTPYHGGTSPSRKIVSSHSFPSIPAFTATWAARNRCAATPVESRVAADVTRREYTGCAGDASVVLYTIEGGGHTWPGGEPHPEWFPGRTSQGVDASHEAWAFFRAHPLRHRP